MRIMYLLILPVFSLLFAKAPVEQKALSIPSVDSTWLLGEGHAGKVCINMDVKKIESMFPAGQIEKGKKKLEGDEYASWKISDSKKNSLISVEVMCVDVCMVSRIYVHSDRYKTAMGAGVGISFSELMKNYTADQLIGFETGGVVVYVEEIPQTGFVFKPAGFKSKAGVTYYPSVIPPDSKVEMVYLY